MRFPIRGFWRTLFPLFCVAVGGGCETARFYSQAIGGQWEIIHRQRPIAQLLADTNTPAELRARFELVLDLRSFAADSLHLPVRKQYLQYADLQRPHVVWNVYAAPEFSLKPRSWWYPIVGRLDYRGFFTPTNAVRLARHLRADGLDVFVGGVEAYSTLGWFQDPLLNTFIFEPESELAELLFHELTHQKLFIAGDTDFNEAFATAMAEEGVRRWLAARHDAAALAAHRIQAERKWQFIELINRTRDKLKKHYDEAKDFKGERTASWLEAQRRAKTDFLDEARAGYLRLKEGWHGDATYDGWFDRRLNNAQLNTVTTYYQLVPAFTRMLAENGGDIPAFYRSVSALKKLSKKERHRKLESLLAGAGP